MFKPYSDAYHSVAQRPGTTIIQITRSGAPFSRSAEVDRHFEALGRALDTCERSRHELLVDIRSAVGRNDPEFEAAVLSHRVRLLRGFRRVAMLVTSIAGQLQMKRLGLQDGVTLRTFYDENEAVEWLMKR